MRITRAHTHTHARTLDATRPASRTHRTHTRTDDKTRHRGHTIAIVFARLNNTHTRTHVCVRRLNRTHAFVRRARGSLARCERSFVSRSDTLISLARSRTVLTNGAACAHPPHTSAIFIMVSDAIVKSINQEAKLREIRADAHRKSRNSFTRVRTGNIVRRWRCL